MIKSGWQLSNFPHSSLVTLVNNFSASQMEIAAGEEEFKSAISRAEYDLDGEDGRVTLVQACAERGLASHVSMLLNKGANPNLATADTSAPILITCSRGDFATLKLFLDENKIDLKVVDQHCHETVLHKILRVSEGLCHEPYEKGLKLILNCEKFPWSFLIK